MTHPAVVPVWRWGSWSAADGTPSAPEVRELFGPDEGRWHAVHATNPASAARLYAGRAAVRDLVRQHELFAWQGFAPSRVGRKPAFAGGMGDFSVAHTEDSLLVAVAPTGQVGVDIETVGDVFDRASLQRRMCSPGELARAPRDRARRREWFASLWTAKEAITKAEGRGLSHDFRLIDLGAGFVPSAAERGLAATIAVRAGGGGRFDLSHPRLAAGTAVSMASSISSAPRAAAISAPSMSAASR